MNPITFEQGTLVPGKIVCIGRNFIEHISELGNEVPDEMVIFAKPNSAIATDLRRPDGEALHYEGEISFLVKGGELVGVAFGLDLTKRTLQTKLKTKGLPWERAKAFDGSALFSDFVPLPPEPDALELELQINGTLAQQGGISQMIHPPAAILREVQSFMTLNDGDLLMTGTPKGVGRLEAGDELCGKILFKGACLVEHRWTVS